MVTQSSYNKIIDFATSICKIFVVVVRENIELSNCVISFLHETKPYLIRVNKQKEWPGTFSVSPRLVYYFELNRNSSELIKRYSHDWSNWEEPNLPEDLSFLKKNEIEWLVSISHEGLMYPSNYTTEECDTISNIIKDNNFRLSCKELLPLQYIIWGLQYVNYNYC